MYKNPKLEQIIEGHEGKKKYVYFDSLKIATIGIGRAIAPGTNGISDEECYYLLRNDINRIYDVLNNYEWFSKQNDVVQGVLIELAFNIGINGLLNFKKMLAALDADDYVLAAKEMLDSKWASQVGSNRSNNMADRMKLGRY